ncbi:hypothetical protein [Streptosporangium sp. NPDC020145]|uniref:hypothetical protein n=1 Tax=Streptosporangium sp. NPDC020145 TaxID=3154694 RepID=UPI00342C17B0
MKFPRGEIVADDINATVPARQGLCRRHPKLPQGESYNDDARLINAIALDDLRAEWRNVALRDDERASAEDVTDALTLHLAERRRAEGNERLLIDMARRREVAWAHIAHLLGYADGDTAQQRWPSSFSSAPATTASPWSTTPPWRGSHT